MATGFKQCSKCGKTKRKTEFGVQKGGRDGLRAQCKECRNRTGSEYHQVHQEDIREYSSARYQEHRAEILGKKHEYNEKHREQSRAQGRRYRQEHPEQAHVYYQEHREDILANVARWVKEHRANVTATQQRRRARKAGNGGSFTAGEWKDLLKHYDYRCLCCEQDDVKLTADHVLPIKMGGTSYISNIQPLCQSCNSKKHDKYIDYRPDRPCGDWT